MNAAMGRVLPRAVTIAAAGVLLLTACGGPRRPSLAAQRQVADALIAEGCYRCLDEAVGRYFALPPARAVARVNDTQLFRAVILLALREKELGLDSTPRFKQAATLVPHTTAPAVAAEQLKWAELVPGNPSGQPRDVSEAERARHNVRGGDVEKRLAGAAAMTDPLDVYLNVSLACARDVILPGGLELAAIAAPAAAHPIVQWRVATCGRSHEDALRTFAEAHPRYVEADYWRGRYRTAMVGDPASRREARERLRAADEAIPGSAAIAYDLAGVVRVTSPKDALPLYERVVRKQPRHSEAWLGQGICLTYLERPRDAIAALTRVIELGRWVVADALYWRAWNHHSLGDLDTAWTDVEAARKSLYNTDVYGLAGRIAYERKELDTGKPLLEKAIDLSPDNCSATWFLGLVHTGQERWVTGAEVFERAETCYRREIQLTLAQLAAPDGETDEAARAARQAQADTTIRNAERQAALSAYNAAFAFVRGAQKDRSKALLDRAVQHPEVSERARELRAFVDR
jgi:tetratricopeptide (TPR) repeat protein